MEAVLQRAVPNFTYEPAPSKCTPLFKPEKTIIVFYSYSGNSEQVARKIQARTGYDTVQIETIFPYPENWREISQELQETALNEKEKCDPPLIYMVLRELGAYDRVILVMPTWWGTIPPPIKSFLDKYSTSRKKLIPVQTHTGQPGTLMEDLMRETGSPIYHPLLAEFSSVRPGRMVTSELTLNQWIISVMT